jgi:hypothetical protein
MALVYLTCTKDLEDTQDCGGLLKRALEKCGGKGGGSRLSASGKTDDVDCVINFILQELEVSSKK